MASPKSIRIIYPIAPPGSLRAGQQTSTWECDKAEVRKIPVVQTNMPRALDSDGATTSVVEELPMHATELPPRLTELQAYRAQYPGGDVKDFSFSPVHRSYYDRLGVTPKEVVDEDVFNRLLENLPTNAW